MKSEVGGRPQINKNGKVSLIIRVHNSEKYLVSCIESALNQTYRNVEIIAVDDGSTDSSPEILDRYSDRIKVVSTRHGGHAAAYNVGIANMEGEWFTSLDSDDVMYPDAIEQKVRAGESLNSSSLTKVIPLFDLQLLRSDGRPKGRTPSYHMNNSMSAFEQGVSLLDRFFGHFAATIIHGSILSDVGGFDERFCRCEDWEFNARLTMIYGYRFHHIPKIVFGYRYHGGQASTSAEERWNLGNKILGAIMPRLSDEDRRKYLELKKGDRRRMTVTKACRCADNRLKSFMFSTHDSRAAELAAKTLGVILDNRLLCYFRDVLAGSIHTVKIKPRQM